MKNIAIIGAGMSGLCFGILAHNKNINIDIYERQETVGKKILLTGNGKCNLNNNIMNESFYYSENEGFVHNFFSDYDNKNAFEFYKKIGILIKNNNDYIYPVSNQAASVLNILLNENKRLNNNLFCNKYIENIIENNNKYYINNKQYDFVIIATGGMAGIYRENEFNSYKMLKKMGIKINRVYPALTRIISDNNYDSSLKGIRLDGTVKLVNNDKIINSEFGEIQFTEKGLSGIAIFQLSLFLGKILDECKNNNTSLPYLLIDFLSNIKHDEFYNYIVKNISNRGDLTISQFLSGVSNNKLNKYILDNIGINESTKLNMLHAKHIDKIIKFYKEFRVNISSLDTFKNAQVSTGGVDLNEINDYFESKKFNNLYMIGEVLDFTGKCGGYNLAFSLGSAWKAAKDITKKCI